MMRLLASVLCFSNNDLLLHYCSASFKNKENIDLSKVASYARTASDVGSTEVQIARLTARVQQISTHLKENRKDFSSRRGLEAVLSQRKRLMQYLYKTNRCVGMHMCKGVGGCGWLRDTFQARSQPDQQSA